MAEKDSLDPTDAEIEAMTPERAQALISAVEAAIAETAEGLREPRPTYESAFIAELDPASRLRLSQLKAAVNNTKNRRKKRRAERDLRQWKRKNIGRELQAKRKLRKLRNEWDRRRSRNRRRADRLANRLSKLRLRAARRATGGGVNEFVGNVGEAAIGVVGGIADIASSRARTAEAEAGQIAADPSGERSTPTAPVPNPDPMPLGAKLPVGAIAAGVGGLALIAFLASR